MPRADVVLPATNTEPAMRLPAIGQGTWHMGESRTTRAAEVQALRQGLDLGLTVIDTAEMYGEGTAEAIVGEALQGRRDEAFVVSKVYPWNAGRESAIAACENSLKRLNTDRLDLYLLHWPGNIPLTETLEAFERLLDQGKIRRFGVSNFDIDDMQTLFALAGGERCAINQVLYHPGSRGIEYAVLPWQRRHALPTMAYCPLAQGGSLLEHPDVRSVAREAGVSTAEVLLAWAIRPHARGERDVIAIPKAVQPVHIAANAGAMEFELPDDALARLDAAFPPPTRGAALDTV